MDSKLFVAIVDNGLGFITTNFFLSYLNSFQGRGDTFVQAFSDSLIPRARNKAAARFLQTDRDYLLFIDTDIVFTKDHIDCLMESNEPVLAGLYCKKERDIAPCYNLLDDKMLPVGGLVEIKRAGTGFIRIHRIVLERMKENPHVPHWTTAPLYHNHGQPEWDFFPTGVKDHEYLSEDWYFCDRARELGFKVMLDTRIQTRHQGVCFYPSEDAIERRKTLEASMNSPLDTPQITDVDGNRP